MATKIEDLSMNLYIRHENDLINSRVNSLSILIFICVMFQTKLNNIPFYIILKNIWEFALGFFVTCTVS